MQHGKLLTVIVAIVILSALFLASPRGKMFLEQSKLKDKIGVVGNFLKSLTGKVASTSKEKPGKIEFHLIGINPVYMNGQKFSLKDSSIDGVINLQTGSLPGFTLSFKDETNVEINGITGDLSFDGNQVRISGKTNEMWLGDVGLNGTDIQISLVGNPVEYSVKNVEKDVLTFQEISGKLTWTGIEETPLMLDKDKLEVYDFKGSIEQKNGLIHIDGYVSYIKLNNIPIGSSS